MISPTVCLRYAMHTLRVPFQEPGIIYPMIYPQIPKASGPSAAGIANDLLVLEARLEDIGRRTPTCAEQIVFSISYILSLRYEMRYDRALDACFARDGSGE